MAIRRGLFGDYYERAKIYRPNALGRLSDGLLGLIVIGLLIWIVGTVSLKFSYVVTSVIMPSETLIDNFIYRDSIQDRTEIFTDAILEKQAQENFKLNELYQQGYRIEVSISKPYSSKLKEHSIENFNIWYKSPDLSIVQTTRKIVSSVYWDDKRAIYSDSGEQIEFTHIAYIRSQMRARRKGNFLIEYKFTPEKIQYLE